ncbi:MAG: tyrosine-type recombinase/integrase [Rhodospirillales bacterium]
MPADNRHLTRRHQTWYVAVEVPPSLQPVLGRRIVRSLKTRDVRVARAKRYAAVAAIQATIAEARQSGSTPLLREAEGWRESILAARRGAVAVATPDPDVDQEGEVRDLMLERVDELLAEGRRADAKLLHDVATGTAIAPHVEPWLAEGGTHRQALADKTKIERRKAIRDLVAWLEREGIGATISAVTRTVAADYVTRSLKASGRKPRTLAKTVHTLLGFWAWLRDREIAPETGRNPWERLAPHAPVVSGPQDGAERAFTADEMLLLFKAPPDATLADFMRVAALTGMRREEIARLTVKDCQGNVFMVQAGKTASARRRVPIHSALATLVAKRCAGKPPTAFLFPDVTGNSRGRGDAIGKRFGNYRERLGIDEGEERRSLVNFHSFRRWFVTEAVNAGQPQRVVSMVVGHKEGFAGITLGTYWRGCG